MAIRSRMARFLVLGMLVALVATEASAQHPDLGADRPAPDPRYKRPRDMHTSRGESFEMTGDERGERCAIRIVGWQEKPRPNFVDTWVMGVKTSPPPATAFIELRIVDESGMPLAIENPTFYLVHSGPTKDWRVLPMNADGYVRIEKSLRDMSERERFSFRLAAEDRVLRELAFTAPHGGGDAYVALSNGATARQYEAYMKCVCDMLDRADARLLFCSGR
jgi:hypothetical protein